MHAYFILRIYIYAYILNVINYFDINNYIFKNSNLRKTKKKGRVCNEMKLKINKLKCVKFTFEFSLSLV